MNKLEFKRFLVSAMEKKLENISREETNEIAEILLSYIELMDNGQIEKADKLLQNNLSLLERII